MLEVPEENYNVHERPHEGDDAHMISWDLLDSASCQRPILFEFSSKYVDKFSSMAGDEESDRRVPVEETPIRMEHVQNAVGFLSHPKVYLQV